MKSNNLRAEIADLKEALLKATEFQRAGLTFEVHKDKLIEICCALKNCDDVCCLTFSSDHILTKIEPDVLQGVWKDDIEQQQ